MSLISPVFGFIFWLIFYTTVGLFIFSLFDLLRNEFRNNDKLVCIIDVVFLSVHRLFLYLTMGRKRMLKN